ncbi:tRNA (cytosine(32)/uridine(32)-2'-O)-methyltransferase TrmJ [Providencia vermicola]|uniref:tRNA (cytidine/uridine-2'-O-)-methyltransferase TrmJ n=1 Tax=Providencia stuartii TaxID=588 RepID=A0AAI9HYU1_PROST|nr:MULTISPECIES: tRNA (cytosine(32)/uridine(32)-2'-O)-methyltransferase TrmJ [Providencia]ELR5035236.1 tRNA (cytosine(32)/uridine(32)-2'-O)-methyltransferase TrmJ [Providencia stuartii]ELR5121606.1 tRNA (cytosine(32)/uridine(32)-2'-O)-methyltransferase TrmJ [Providencia stuartii]ELR5141144.1 tRNA (cytosine(32)/uridine(32)-2'-O)-methyltransferase TrmJ [Providencia stuartii]MTB41804.1 tRNA (cytosine(32)/uridine(32)-2'-O)-methyltransferase TrmJ [Providencia sp. wls1949]MTC10178.1 tRNA (cytosine(3
MLDNIRIILVETSHTGNMGSTARAMKTMGLSNLYLVNPQVQPDSHAIALSAGASDVIGQATIVNSLDEALEGCQLVIGTSARSRTLSWPMVAPRECGEKSVEQAKTAPVAIIFGRERIGLTNEELQKCQYHLYIPTNPEYGSLNLAMAVQLVSYEIRMAYLALDEKNAVNSDSSEVEYPPAQDIERFYVHLESVLNESGFIRKAHPGLIMNKLRRLFTRAHIETQELHILRGILTSMEKWAKK